MSSPREKRCIAVLALILLVAALVVMSVGSFLPLWASERNNTVHGNVSFSLWARQECFSIICTTKNVRVQWTNEDCWYDSELRKERCEATTGYKMRSTTKCRPADFCNSTWVGVTDVDDIPSLLIVARAFTMPAMCAAVIAIVLYVIKLVLLVKRPNIKRQHLKAAYLTFGAIAGVVSMVGVTLFCTMLDNERYERHWAPYLILAGGIACFLFGFGGYLRWRDRTAGGTFEDDTSLFDGELSELRPAEIATDGGVEGGGEKGEEGETRCVADIVRQFSQTEQKMALDSDV